MAKSKAKKITRAQKKKENDEAVQRRNEIRTLKLQLAAAKEKKSGEESSEQSEENKRKIEELDKKLQDLSQDYQMDSDNEDGGNGIGSKDVDKGSKDVDKGSKDVDERPIESIEPNGEREPLFIPQELQDVGPQGVKQTPVKQESLE